jgi:hypothetical protein
MALDWEFPPPSGGRITSVTIGVFSMIANRERKTSTLAFRIEGE